MGTEYCMIRCIIILNVLGLGMATLCNLAVTNDPTCVYMWCNTGAVGGTTHIMWDFCTTPAPGYVCTRRNNAGWGCYVSGEFQGHRQCMGGGNQDCSNVDIPCTNGWSSGAYTSGCDGNCAIQYPGVSSGTKSNPGDCLCKAGYGSSDGKASSGCSLCGIGYYSGEGQSCQSCTYGTASDGKIMNPSGATGHTTDACEWICNIGFYLNTGACSGCIPGQYSSITASTSCLNCLAGTYQPLSKQTSCIACNPVGSYNSNLNTGGYSNVDGANICSKCDIFSSDMCTVAYQYYKPCTSTTIGSCIDCTYSSKTGAAQCPTGKFLNNSCDTKAYHVVDSSCSPCPTGTYSSISSLTTQCTACATGTYTSATGTITCQACTNTPGTYLAYKPWSTTAISATCPTWCIPGSYVSDTTCTLCVAGQYSTGYGMASCAQCSNKPALNSNYLTPVSSSMSSSTNCAWTCNAGYYKNITSLGCSQCASGYYMSSVMLISRADQAQPSCAQCTRCLTSTIPAQYTSVACLPAQNSQCNTCSEPPTQKYVSKTCYQGKTGGTGTDTASASCTLNCGIGTYKSSACVPGTSTTLGYNTDCRACGDPVCNYPGLYMPSKCPGTTTSPVRCVSCTYKACPSGYYKQLCSGYNDTTCQPYTKCSKGYYLTDYTLLADGKCLPCSTCSSANATIRECNAYQNTECSTGITCNQTSPCAQTPTQSYFCDLDGTSSPACGLCPAGYSSDGIQCQACPPNVTCGATGNILCPGTTNAGFNVLCVSPNNGPNQAPNPRCVLPDPLVTDRIVTRGSYSGAPDSDCAAYFQCTPGTYLAFYAQGHAQCDDCNYTLSALEMWASPGLTPDNPNSCLATCDPAWASWNGTSCVSLGRNFAPVNEAGYYATLSDNGQATTLSAVQCPGVAPVTSRTNAASDITDCVTCPPAPDSAMYTTPANFYCGWTCNTGFTQRGDRCVKIPVPLDAPQVGMTSTSLATYMPTALPYQPAGQYKTGVTPVLVNRPVNNSQVNQANGYTFTTYVTTPVYKAAYWTINVTTPDHKTSPNLLPGRVCSSSAGTILNQTYLYLVFCNQSFVTYTAISATGKFAHPPRILIGSPMAGYREGAQDTALFGPELYIAQVNGSRLLLADTWHCVLRLINIPAFPGHFLTTSYLVAGIPSRCYDKTNTYTIGMNLGELTLPRRVFPLLNNSRFVFATANAIYQFAPEYMQVSQMLNTADHPEVDTASILDIQAWDNYTVYLTYLDKTLALSAEAQNCPDLYTSLQGGSCTTPCPRDSYVDGYGVCTSCYSDMVRMTCVEGSLYTACAARSAPSCTLCPQLTNISGKYSMVYTTPGDCSIENAKYIFPCPRNYYPDASGTCITCPAFSSTEDDSATSIQQCKCVRNAAIVNGTCVIGQPYPTLSPPPCRGVGFTYYNKMGTCVPCSTPPCPVCSVGSYSTSQCACLPCTYPGHATVTTNGFMLDNATSCSWTCNTGYYQAGTEACLACTSVPQHAIPTSSGQRGHPLSCEWSCLYGYTKRLRNGTYTCG